MPGYARPPQYIAESVVVQPSGDLTSTDVQAALIELEAEYVYSSSSPTNAEVGTLWVDSNDFTTYVNSASGWQVIGGAGGGATGGGENEAFYENDITITEDYTITTNKNAGTFGPITIGASATVTIPDGSTWVIV